ncbi:serine/threonine protein phosphatase [Helicobacter aurati]|uniref:Serine/threonine protein phosphatase n=1 Tax=Helicobacter aurati TaxID=137778 RepID=A0A3D8J6Q9_9HELI|nr:metallophosphoesterase [Helicobacter aurati]RDU73112.1 serine/threonine protein phosphatase [Helicobacter aurati]
MRYLLLTRGMPLCGKTTWIQQNNLQEYTLDTKTLAYLFQSPKLDVHGNHYFYHHKLYFTMLYEALKSRMANGDFIIIEDSHIAHSYFSNYQELAKIYAYTIVIVDFSDVPLEEILKRAQQITQSQTLQHRHYTHEEIMALYQELQQTQIPIPSQVIKPQEIDSFLRITPYNLNGYKKIYHIGDIHGCFRILQKHLATIQDDCFYIFLGDYIDRGLQNYEVLKFLTSIMHNKNVCLLEGNHEKWLWHWANHKEIHSREFRLNTQKELEQKGFSKREAKLFYNKLVPYFYYRFHDKYVLCTHGGLSNIPQRFRLLSASECIYGVGNYTENIIVANAFSNNTDSNHYQIFGHRNKEDLPLNLAPRNYLLEGRIEFGGFLRTLELNQQGFHDTSIRNTLFITNQEKQQREMIQKDFEYMQRNNLAQNLDYQSFVAYRKPSTKAKPCTFYPYVIDTNLWRIVARGIANDTYHSFTTLQNKNAQIDYPLTIYATTMGETHLISYYNEKFYFITMNDKPSITQKIPQGIQLDTSCAQEIITLLQNTLKTPSFSLQIQRHLRGWTLTNIFANSFESHELNYPTLDKVAKLLNIHSITPIITIQSQEMLQEILPIFYQQQTHTNHFLLETCIADLTNNDCQESTQIATLPDTFKQDSKVLESLQNFSCLIKQKSFLFCNIFAYDSKNNFYECRSFITQEYRVMEHIVKIWSLQNTISRLQWINTDLREIFYIWFIAQREIQHSLLQMPFNDIWNLFLLFLWKAK